MTGPLHQMQILQVSSVMSKNGKLSHKKLSREHGNLSRTREKVLRAHGGALTLSGSFRWWRRVVPLRSTPLGSSYFIIKWTSSFSTCNPFSLHAYMLARCLYLFINESNYPVKTGVLHPCAKTDYKTTKFILNVIRRQYNGDNLQVKH